MIDIPENDQPQYACEFPNRLRNHFVIRRRVRTRATTADNIRQRKSASRVPLGTISAYARGVGRNPTHHWRLLSGSLPHGLELHDDGEIAGKTDESGKFEITLLVRDSNNPPNEIRRNSCSR